MGISNLLIFLRPLIKHVTLENYKGQTLGVDAMCWMHRGAIACASELILTGKASHKFIQFVMKMIALLLEYEIRPIMVFDGRNLPIKALENKSRQDRREKAKLKAQKLIKNGVSSQNKKVQSLAMQAIHVTDEMIERLIEALRRAQIEFLISPFEADAQLAYLCRSKIVSAVITEDSDLLAYGCPRVLFKLTPKGEVEELNLPDAIVQSMVLPEDFINKNSQEVFPNEHNEELSEITTDSSLSARCSNKLSPETETLRSDLSRFTWTMFVTMCVMTGCDYTRNAHIPGIGISLSYQLAKKHKTIESVLRYLIRDPKWSKRLQKVFSECSLSVMDGKNATEEFLTTANNSFTWDQVVLIHILAGIVFSEHRVYDPRNNLIVPVHFSGGNGIHLTTSREILKKSFKYGKFQFKAKNIFGDIEMDPWTLFMYASGNLERTSVKFSTDEDSVISYVQSKVQGHRTLKMEFQKQHLYSKFLTLFSPSSTETQIRLSSIGGGGTGLMERLFLEKKQIEKVEQHKSSNYETEISTNLYGKEPANKLDDQLNQFTCLNALSRKAKKNPEAKKKRVSLYEALRGDSKKQLFKQNSLSTPTLLNSRLSLKQKSDDQEGISVSKQSNSPLNIDNKNIPRNVDLFQKAKFGQSDKNSKQWNSLFEF